jgi:hypothetical protein
VPTLELSPGYLGITLTDGGVDVGDDAPPRPFVGGHAALSVTDPPGKNAKGPRGCHVNHGVAEDVKAVGTSSVHPAGKAIIHSTKYGLRYPP